MFRRTVLLALGCFCMGQVAQAATSMQSNVRIDGTIVAKASCNFTGNNPIIVEYGEVYISDISSGKYSQPVDFGSLQCTGDPGSKKLQMQISGTASTVGGVNALNTSLNGLGIQFLQNNSAVNMNQWFDVNASSPPVVMAKLVKNSGATLSSGQEFNANAVLLVAYN